MLQVPERFSKNQLDFLSACKFSWLNVSEGGKRAGKNILNDFAFCTELEHHKNKLFLVAGVTQGTARLNVLDCDGFGVYNFFHGRYRKGKYENKEAIFIRTKCGEKIIIVVGGKDKSSYKIIKGNTYGMAYLTESNELNIDFVNEVFDRTISSSNRKIFMDLDPKAPNHWFYKMLDFHKQKQMENQNYGYNYGHFTLVDNMSLSDEKIREVLNTYDKTSIYYKRDIRGERIACEGLCFPQLAETFDEHEITEESELLKRLAYVRIGVDFGGNLSQHTFIATGFTRNWKEVVVLESKRIDAKGITPSQLTDMYCDFVTHIVSVYGFATTTRCDSAEQTLINGFKFENGKRQLNNIIKNALKTEIIDRIRLTNTLVAQNRLWFLKGKTQSLREALCTAVWDKDASDSGKDERLDNGTSDIDSLDAFEYTIEEDRKYLINSAS